MLSGFSGEERASLPALLTKSAKSVVDVARRGFDAAMKAANTRPKPPKPPKSPAESPETAAIKAPSSPPKPDSSR